MADNVAGLVAYITIIPAIIFLVMAPYSKKLFVRFHAFQSLFLHVALFALWIIFMILFAVFAPSGFDMFSSSAWGMWRFLHLLWDLALLAYAVLAIVSLLKAYQGQMWKLPIIGDIAEKQAKAA
jgi:uncharacterized membrane protein